MTSDGYIDIFSYKYYRLGDALTLIILYLGVDLSGLLVAGGVVGIVIGFASQSIVGNLISGIFLMFERPIEIGDQMRVDDISGFVEDIHIVSTIVRTYNGLYVRIPNEKVFASIIYSATGINCAFYRRTENRCCPQTRA